ncbi:MAG TPA: energy transducer TonB [Candidatus Angelobacter sp.]|nr:energy transducer TonB [Candidatus Angelobacter sp.]
MESKISRSLTYSTFLVLASILFSGYVFARPLCRGGDNGYSSEFRTGVEVRVGAQRNAGFATRECEATLRWKKETLTVAADVDEIDLDVFGANLELKGPPVAAFQIKKSSKDCCAIYKIYSLAQAPQLLRTIEGGISFSATDKDLDGRIEIWVDDTARILGLDDLSSLEIGFPPMCVLRMEHGQLMNVGSQFWTYFDQTIAAVRAEMNSEDLKAFKMSDGKVTYASIPDTNLFHKLRVAKVQVLEIVWAYLYSDREQEAWRALHEMWPEGDTDRMQLALANAHANGVMAQTDGTAREPFRRRKNAEIFDLSKVSRPQAISLWSSPFVSPVREFSMYNRQLDLLIDAAGKVLSAKPARGQEWQDEDLLRAATEWKFIPAVRAGRSVATHLRMPVWPKQ